MKALVKVLSLFSVLVVAVTSCQSTINVHSTITEILDTTFQLPSPEGQGIELIVQKGKAFNHPTFVFWMEDAEGNLLQTFYVTQSYATGVYGFGAETDNTWKNEKGEAYRPAALPYWTHKKGLINGDVLVPNAQHPYVDAFSGATPLTSFNYKGSLKQKNDKPFRVLLEVNQTWDWNEHWFNSKYPDDVNYKHSAQPSVVYAVMVDPAHLNETYYLNPIGHGHPSGSDGKLYTDIKTLTSALEIFKSIKIIIK